jgi:hypothetical protein
LQEWKEMRVREETTDHFFHWGDAAPANPSSAV